MEGSGSLKERLYLTGFYSGPRFEVVPVFALPVGGQTMEHNELGTMSREPRLGTWTVSIGEGGNFELIRKKCVSTNT